MFSRVSSLSLVLRNTSARGCFTRMVLLAAPREGRASLCSATCATIWRGGGVIPKWKGAEDNSSYDPAAPIWVCWWQGLEEAPLLVRRCVESLWENAAGHEVRILTRETVPGWLDVPRYMLEAADEGRMRLANLADYVRCALIYRYGGLWVDATVFVSAPVPDNAFDASFYTLKWSHHADDADFVAAGRWVTYVLGGWAGQPLFGFVKDAFESWWSRHATSIDYFLIDYCFQLAYEEVPAARNAIDAVPLNNLGRYRLRDAMLREAPAEEWGSCLDLGTVFHKLSYKSLYGLTTPDGRPTVYSTLLDGGYKGMLPSGRGEPGG